MYSELVRMHREEGLDFSQVRVFNLDEYIGVQPDDPRSFHSYLWNQLLGLVNIQPQNVRLAPFVDDAQALTLYEEEIRRAGGIDLLIAGVGSNGHVAFNEPCSAMDSRTRAVRLADSTIDRIRGVFAPQEPPARAVTMGIATILEARRILLIAAGEAKSQPTLGLLNGCITESNPVSLLYSHPDMTVLLDSDAYCGRGL
jgi:glucosamine-6-phosphate deaminase